MSLSENQQLLMESLLDELIRQYRAGESPKLEEVCDLHPTLALTLRELFPTLCFLEQNKPKTRPTISSPSKTIDREGRIGDYQLIRVVGRGGMGIVYEALQLSLHRHVALKIISPHLASDPFATARFQREARASAHLHHSNIVPIFDVGIDNSTCFYAMQFIPGQSLDQILAELKRIRGRNPNPADQSAVGDISLLLTRVQLDTADVAPSGVQRASIDRATFDQQPEALGTQKSSSAVLASKRVEHPSTNNSSKGNHSHLYHRNVATLGLQLAEALAYPIRRYTLFHCIRSGFLCGFQSRHT